MAREFSKAFYNSKEWQEVRRFVLMRDCFLCQKCGKPAEEVHHIVHLNPENIGNPKITMNPDNLTCLCRDCHFKEHTKDKADGHRHNPRNTEIDNDLYEFDEQGMLVRKSPL